MSLQTTHSTYELFTAPGKPHQALLTTFRRNGVGVTTQVGTVAADGKVYFMTAADTGKARRLANNPRVTLAPSTMRGQAAGPVIEGQARRLSGEEKARARAIMRVGVLGRFWSLVFDRRNPGEKTVVYEVELNRE